MKVGVPSESFAGERRVALTPLAVPALIKAGGEVLVEAGAGSAAGYADAEYAEKGARTVARDEVFNQAELLLTVRVAGADPAHADAQLGALRGGQVVVGFAEPLGEPRLVQRFAERGVSLLAVELMPRITRAQSMDALSSMATIAGYKAVLLAADHLPRLFPMLMTAAGTLQPARVLVVGAGVAGLQAIATARRNGAVVEAYDVRPAVKEQVESLGAKFIELPLSVAEAEDAGGYAREQTADFLARQRELMGRAVAASDVVISTAAVPGKKAPVLITAEMVRRMRAGSVVVDLAAERGGNCELTRAGERVEQGGVTVLGPLNLASAVPYHASQMYARNLTTFVLHLVKDGRLHLDREDEITAATLVAHEGEVVHPVLRQLLDANGG